MNDNPICTICCQTHPSENLTDFRGHLLCPTCLEAQTLVCRSCGERIWRNENAGTTDIPLCQSCYEEDYTTCDDCGRLISLDDAFYYEGSCRCPECDHWAHHSHCIEEYSYKPIPNFCGDGLRYFGVELEVDRGGEDEGNAEELLSIANAEGQDRLYIKHDGSLNDGFELVTHPMTLDYHLSKMPWADLLKTAREQGYRSHQTSTCGYHIHVNRDAFGETEDEQEPCIARILYFVEKHWEELLKFSRRTASQLDHWAARYGYKEHPLEILDRAKCSHGDRYTCINLSNTETIEFRMFRGTLKLNTLFATLQLVDRICDVALFLSDQELKDLSWTTFVTGCQRPELVQYLKERRLYVNEPVSGEEEV